MSKITFMTLGDPHFKSDGFYLSRVEEMGKKFVQLCKEKKPDFIVNLGDTLHTHSKIDMVAQTKAIQFMRELKDIAPLYVLIGNHDRLNNSEFLTDVSPFQSLKDWKNTFIVDDHVAIKEAVREDVSVKFFFAPYVPTGRLREALEHSGVKENECVLGFAHQEFKNARMGAIISEEGDEPLSCPVISGHLHDQQMISTEGKGDVNYVGTPIAHSHGEHGKKTVSFFTLSTEEIPSLFSQFWCKSKGFFIYEEKIDLGVKKLRTLHLDAKDFLKHEFEEGEDPRYYRIVITGKDSDIRLAKKSDNYQEFENLGCRIHFPFVKGKYKEERQDEKEMEGKIVSYHQAVEEKLKERKDLFKLYEEILRGE